MNLQLSHKVTVLGLVAAALLGGCYEQRIVRDSFADLRQLSDTRRGPRGARQVTGQAEGPGWTILVAEFEGNHRHQRAEQLIQQLIHEAGVSDLWIESSDRQTRVLRGIYPSNFADNAQRDLLHTQMVTINGSQPFAEALLVPLGPEGAVISDSAFDLRRHSGALSLQIGYYDEEMGPDFRDAAEEAVKALREQGEDAYFYHGPNMSHVTVGLFTQEDRVQRVMRTPEGRNVVASEYSDRVRELQRRFPYNLGNGRTIIDVSDDGDGKPLESFLVQIP